MVLREGRWLAIGLLLTGVLLSQLVGWWVVLVSALLAAAVLFLFRNPHRNVPALPLAVVSPADGRVTKVQDCDDSVLGRAAVCIGLHMNVLDSYIFRSPVEGKVMRRWHSHSEEVTREEGYASRNAFWIQTDEGDDVVMLMDKLSRLQSPRCFVLSGERVGQGQRCGSSRFGTDVELYLPAGSRVEVRAGAKVRAGETPVATLIRTGDFEPRPPAAGA